MIKITNLNKYFYKNKNNEIHVINNATFEFPQTGLVTIFGESGSGKTTLMNVLGGLDNFHAGEIEIDGQKISKYNSRVIDKIRNEKIGYIFQNYLLLHQRNVYENLKIILDMYDISEEEKNERIEYVLKSVGMLRYKKKNVSKLSGGQQQRVAIARALIKSPSLILADEPTGNLDEKNTIQIMNIIKKISETTLVILVSHEHKLARSYSDYIINVSDGQIKSTQSVMNETKYQYTDDNNLYLKEYKYTKIENENVNIDFYSNSNQKINLQIVYENGKFYLKTNDNALYLDDSNEISMINDHRKALDTTEVLNDNNYNLSKLQYKRSPRLSFKETIKLALSNLKKLKKRTVILSFPLIIISLLTILFVQGVESARVVDYKNISAMDSHVYNVSIEKTHAKVEETTFVFGYEHFYKEFLKENPNIEPVLNTTLSSFQFKISEFSQIENRFYYMEGFSILPLEFIDKSDLIYGRMPKLANEIVVEKWVLEKTIEDSTLHNFKDVYSFLDDEVTQTWNYRNYKIVGIADTNENTVYMNKWSIFNIFPSNITKFGHDIISYSEFEKYFDHDLEFEINKNECLVNKQVPFAEDVYSYMINQDESLILNRTHVLDFEGAPFDLVVSDELFDEIFFSVITTDYTTFDVYCINDQEKEQVDKYIEKINPYYSSGDLKVSEELGYVGVLPEYTEVRLEFNSYSQYDQAVKPYEEESQRVVNSRILITACIILVGAIIIYFSMKSFTIKNIYDIGVYRALGIRKGSIILVYLTEIFMISLKSSIVFSTIAFLIYNFVASIPTINIEMIEFKVFSISMGSLLSVNLLSGVLPIIGYLKLTPSQILSKYDI